MKSFLNTLRKWLGMTSAPRLVATLVGPVTFVCGLLTVRNVMTEAQATWIVFTALPAAVGALYWILAQTDEAVAERAVAQAPQTTMHTMVEEKPQAAMDAVEAMDGVKMIVADKRFADANPNQNVVNTAQAIERLSHGGISP